MRPAATTAALLLVSLSATAFEGGSGYQELRKDLEASIQTRILDPILGRGRASAFVDIELELRLKRDENIRSGIGDASRFRSKPSHGAEATQSQHSTQERSEEETVTSASWTAKRFKVTVLHDQTIPPEQLAAVRRSVLDAYSDWNLTGEHILFRPIPSYAGRAGPFDPAGLLLGLLSALGLGLGLRARGRANDFALRPLVAPAAVAGAFAAVIWSCEGSTGFRPFLNLEALALVLIGTVGIVGASQPLRSLWQALAQALRDEGGLEDRWRSAGVLAAAARAAVVSGLAATALGIILSLSSISDLAELPKRISLALTSGLFGIFLSEFVFTPMSRRCASPKHRADV